jgi:type IV fimbrial biogenesis protein FimT
MRPLKCERGLTLVELMVAVAIGGVLVVAAAPFFGDYIVNSRLREGGNLLLTEALIAQSEAVKRNTAVRLAVIGTSVRVQDITNPGAPVLLRDRLLGGGVSAAALNIDFDGQGRPTPFPTSAAINLSTSAAVCSSDHRCPGLRVDAGGAIRLCGDHLDNCN